MWYFCTFCPCLILYSGHCGVIQSCLILLWFYGDSFLIATVSTTPNIISMLNVWAMRLVIIVCLSVPQKLTGVCVLAFASCSHRYCLSVTGICLKCFVFSMIALTMFITHSQYDHPCWSLLLPSITSYASRDHNPPSGPLL